MISPDEVLHFWLREVGPDRWYVEERALDADIGRRFGAAIERARSGAFDDWTLTPRGALALLILLDQFPRNIHRGRGEAFRGDAVAVAQAKRALNLGHDRKVPEPERQFFYLPLMHSECLTDQDRCVRLMMIRMPETGGRNLPHAVAHRDVIRRFGRFPYRNAALGRASTDDERAWLAEGGYRVN
jgi:uncharacterized protein (DUF924 family)